ncbi:N-acetylglucosamine kinase [Marinimicrobium sp. ARAG 43.8]|uniref:N-acetylglucosamine kinase n=1 Tax=Marinimicrobium sp. ARAG 43.8 TaxID=3418719 RepID=UPI003CE9BBD5
MVNIPTGSQLYLGIDGGGSKCQASLVDEQGQVLSTALAGPANPLHGVERTLQSIESAARRALKEVGLGEESLGRLVVGAGLAGVNLPSLYKVVSDWPHPFSELHLTTDLRIACLGAHQRDDGAVIVTGTGSCGYVRVDGKDRLIGGHGFPYGDQGSGAWMGMEAIKAVLLASDGLGPQTALTDSVADLLQARGLAIVERMSGRPSSEYAKLAPLVFTAAEADDPVAFRIVTEGADYVSAMADKLLSFQPARLSLIGGVAERITPWLSPQVAERLAEPLGPPEDGAVLFARQQHALAKTA